MNKKISIWGSAGKKIGNISAWINGGISITTASKKRKR
jgi:hypothetical protein